MWRYLVGAAATALLLVAGALLFGRARTEPLIGKPPPASVSSESRETDAEPMAVPAATERTREEKRFDRYDKDRNDTITREEYLASRRKAFAKLDTNHDGKLGFDEWAARTITKFATADADRSNSLNRTEFATTKVKRSPRRPQKCPPASPAPEAE